MSNTHGTPKPDGSSRRTPVSGRNASDATTRRVGFDTSEGNKNGHQQKTMRMPAVFSRTRLAPYIEAVVVTILWSSSVIIIKLGLDELPPLSYAAARYALAAMILTSAVVSRTEWRQEVKTLTRSGWMKLLAYGIVTITVTQGTWYIGLGLLPAATVGLMLSFTTVVVATLGVVFLKEVPNTKQILLIIAAFVGALIYFHPFGSQDLGETTGWGLLVVGIGVLANGVAQLQGRDLNRTRTACPLVVTATSMAFGTIVLFVIALFVEGMPDFSIKAIVFILWLAVVNTALAFTMWNHALTKLEAAEIAIINNTMLAQVAILAAIFLAEIPDTLEWIGLTMVAVTALLYQLAAKPRNRELGLKPLNDEICVEQVEMDEE